LSQTGSNTQLEQANPAYLKLYSYLIILNE
jgi:hypothetical protein